MRYGVLGGTFDPPHLGHVALAEAAHDALQLDEVLLVPGYQNPLKRRQPAATGAQRFAMCGLLAHERPWLAVSDIELTRKGPSYALETMEELTYSRPGDYWFVMGADALASLPQWREPAKLLRLCRVAVVARTGTRLEGVLNELDREWRRVVDVVEMPNHPVSSSKIREDVARGRPTDRWLTAALREYIEREGLYLD
ncbi:MAG: nicotinate (nicotinamide) nucleotide adenylyltransferase [Fimbriimonadaceae bacterium]|nr:nicotinate (nicotinamide) nucleotide adenylyltransferase [Fimbriimonadaceae bacterium]QYK54878.1 MAG: nicotinate (nicotinamide) nucleotide adenylyltransferase [Fimbriimonadaceae bacterium]